MLGWGVSTQQDRSVFIKSLKEFISMHAQDYRKLILVCLLMLKLYYLIWLVLYTTFHKAHQLLMIKP